MELVVRLRSQVISNELETYERCLDLEDLREEYERKGKKRPYHGVVADQY